MFVRSIHWHISKRAEQTQSNSQRTKNAVTELAKSNIRVHNSKQKFKDIMKVNGKERVSGHGLF